MQIIFNKNKLSQISDVLKSQLTGFKSHEKLFPPNRIRHFDNNLYPKPKKSSVLIILYNNPYGQILFTLRKAYNGVHSSQVSFPGGKMELSDPSYLDTAIRETFEEINIQVDKNNIIGGLSELYIPPSNFIVKPFIAYLPNIEPMKANADEVEEIFFGSIDILVKQSKKLIYENIYTSNNEAIVVPGFKIDEKFIWGATAMILQEFIDILLIANTHDKN